MLTPILPFLSFQSKFFARSIDEILVSPNATWIMIAGFIGGGVIRGCSVGTIVLLVSLFFTSLSLTIASIAIILYLEF